MPQGEIVPQKEQEPQFEQDASSLFDVGIWLLLAIAAISTIGVIATGSQRVDQFKELGTWGDFVGGLLNPILTFITFLAVLLTILLQRQELSLTRREMKRSANALEKQDKTLNQQSFENTYFEMLRLHNTILESIDLRDAHSGHVTKGRDAFSVFYNRLTKIYRANWEKANNKHNKREVAELAYFLFWKDAKTELGHYFRFLFNFFRFIENSDVSDDFYPKLLRSQLSDQELLILFYNNLSEHGEPFRHFANKYELFDNLPVERLLDKQHAEFADKVAFGKNPMNFRPNKRQSQPLAKVSPSK